MLGVDTNIADLRALIADPAVRAGDLDTGLLDRRGTPDAVEPPAVALAAVARRIVDAGNPGIDGVWGRVGAWRAGGAASQRTVSLEDDAGRVHAVAPGTADGAVVTGGPVEYWVHADGGAHRLRVVSRRDAAARRRAAAGRAPGAVDPDLVAPLPGTVVAVHVADGDTVEAGARLLTIEAMKMEHTVVAPHAGTVRLRTAASAQVARDAVVATVTPEVGEPHDHAGTPASARTTSAIRTTSVADVGVAAEDVRIAEALPAPREPVPADPARTTSAIRTTSVADRGVAAEDVRIAEALPGPRETPRLSNDHPGPHDHAGAPASTSSHKETLP